MNGNQRFVERRLTFYEEDLAMLAAGHDGEAGALRLRPLLRRFPRASRTPVRPEYRACVRQSRGQQYRYFGDYRQYRIWCGGAWHPDTHGAGPRGMRCGQSVNRGQGISKTKTLIATG
jgi:hypothetical protein